jgi:hypothetical protein
MSKLNSIVRLQSHENRTPTGRQSATATRKLVNYLSYGRGRPAIQAQREPRGQWLDQTGRVLTHEQVLAWVVDEGKGQQFTHQFILSVKYAQLAESAYGQVLSLDNPYFQEWRLLVHHDARYPHAHVVTFGESEIRIKSPQFQAWALSVRQELEREQQATLAQQLAAGLEHKLRHQSQQELVEGLDLTTSSARQAMRQQEVELDLEWEVDL